MSNSSTAELYFIIAMMILILILSAAAMIFFTRQYKKEKKGDLITRKNLKEFEARLQSNQPVDAKASVPNEYVEK